MEDIQAEGDAAQIGEPVGDVSFGQAEQAEEEEDTACEHEGPAEDRAGGGRVGIPASYAEPEERREPAGERRDDGEEAEGEGGLGESAAKDEREEGAGGKELELDEAVGPLAVVADRGVEGVMEDDRVGDGEQEGAGDLEGSPAAEGDEEGDGDVELLLDGDAPEGVDGPGDPAVAQDVPVAGEEGEGEPGGVGEGADAGEEMREEGEAVEGQEVQRPDAEDATDVEGLHMDAAGLGALADEEFGDEEGAEEEEDRDTEGSGGAEAEEPGVVGGVGGDVVHAVETEDEEEGEEAEGVEFGAVVAAQSRLLLIAFDLIEKIGGNFERRVPTTNRSVFFSKAVE